MTQTNRSDEAGPLTPAGVPVAPPIDLARYRRQRRRRRAWAWLVQQTTAALTALGRPHAGRPDVDPATRRPPL